MKKCCSQAALDNKGKLGMSLLCKNTPPKNLSKQSTQSKLSNNNLKNVVVDGLTGVPEIDDDKTSSLNTSKSMENYDYEKEGLGKDG